jgi:cullin 1
MQVVPPELEPSIESFTKFYSSQHTGRKLTWLHHLSRMDVRTSGYGKTYELNTSVPQFLLLRQYNNQSSLTVKRLVEESLMPLADARKNLKILIESELLKAQDSSLSENSVVEWNPSFVR